MENILFRYATLSLIHYTPNTTSSSSEQHETPKPRILKGCEYGKLHERYGGIAKVKDARTIGLIIGSMSYAAVLTNRTIQRLQSLLTVGKKACYTFLLGKLNEAKLCNFPEIDVFVLFTNEANLTIPPKTYPFPVITPYELEIGLGAREWDSTLLTNLGNYAIP